LVKIIRKSAFLAVLPTLFSLKALQLARVFPYDLGYKIWSRKTSPLANRCWKPRHFTAIGFDSISASDGQTDRHDVQTDTSDAAHS